MADSLYNHFMECNMTGSSSCHHHPDQGEQSSPKGIMLTKTTVIDLEIQGPLDNTVLVQSAGILGMV